MPNNTPQETPTFRTPFESAPPPAPIEPRSATSVQPKIIPPEVPMLGSRRSEKILIEIKRLRLKTVKRALMVLTLITIAVFIGTTLRDAILGKGSIATPALLIILFLSFFPFTALLLKWHTFILANIAAFLFMAGPFMADIPPTTIIGFGLAAAMLASLSGFVMAIKSWNLVGFRLNTVMGAGMGLFILALATTFTGIYYYHSITPRAMSQEFFMPRESIEKILKFAEKPASKFVLNFKAEMTVDEFAGAIIESRKNNLLSGLRKDPFYAVLSDDAKQRAEKEILVRARGELVNAMFKMLNEQTIQNMKFSEFAWILINNYFINLSPQLKQFAVLGWLAVVSFTIIAVGSVFKIAALITSWILLQILLGIRFFEIAREPSERKVLRLS